MGGSSGGHGPSTIMVGSSACPEFFGAKEISIASLQYHN